MKKSAELKNFGLIPDMAASQYGDRTVFFFRDEEQSFAGLSERSNKVANALSDEDVKPGDRVCLYCPHTPQFPEAYFGIIKVGGIPVPLNLRMPLRTLKYVVENSDADMIIGSNLETRYSGPDEVKRLAEETEIGRLILPGEEGDDILE